MHSTNMKPSREEAGRVGVYLPEVFEEDQIVKSKAESPAPPRRVCVAAASRARCQRPRVCLGAVPPGAGLIKVSVE